jgi:LacI family transcriptional regulator
VLSAAEELQRRGYRRPGFFVERFRDELVERRWSSAFGAVQMRLPKRAHVPVFIKEHMEAGEFVRWFERHKPDVVIGHSHDVMAWLKGAGYRNPDDYGFFALNRLLTGENCSGLDHRPGEIGSVGVDMVVGQIYRNERGVPNVPRTVLIDANFVEGSTLAPSAYPVLNEPAAGKMETRDA